MLSAAAHNKHFRLSVESVGPLIVKGVHLRLAQASCLKQAILCHLKPSRRRSGSSYLQGPVAEVFISEVSLGHTRNASKAAQAALSWQFKLPFTVRNLTIELRQSIAAGKLTHAQVSPSHKHTRSSNSRFSATTKTLLNTGLRLVLSILPSIPIRVKQLVVKQVGLLVRICLESCLTWMV